MEGWGVPVNQETKRERGTRQRRKEINLLRNAAADWGIYRARRDAAESLKAWRLVQEAEDALVSRLQELEGELHEREKNLKGAVEKSERYRRKLGELEGEIERLRQSYWSVLADMKQVSDAPSYFYIHEAALQRAREELSAEKSG